MTPSADGSLREIGQEKSLAWYRNFNSGREGDLGWYLAPFELVFVVATQPPAQVSKVAQPDKFRVLIREPLVMSAG